MSPSTDASIDPLAAVLRAEPPAGIAALPDDVRRQLADLLRTAIDTQRSGLADAAAQGLDFVPRPLRGAVRKAVGL